MLLQNILLITFTPLYLQLHTNHSVLQTAMFFLSRELGPLWPKLDPSNYWALPLECSSFLSSLNLAVQHPYPFSKLISTLGVFTLGALLSGLNCEQRFINLEIRYDTKT